MFVELPWIRVNMDVFMLVTEDFFLLVLILKRDGRNMACVAY